MKLFDKNFTIGLQLHTDAEAVRLAALDLQRDLRQLSGQAKGFPLSGAGLIVRILPGEPESYTVEISDRVIITGGDVLGAVYGIYAFATQCLGILPVHRLVDVFPKTRESMELAPCRIHSPKRSVRFRGWFLNDEDLLTELRYSGGKRHIDYPFYGDVMHTDVLDMILEAALRLEINLVIPASFVDILNPDEEALVQAVCRRGLYISQHHVEPVGVSFFAADAYIQKHGNPGEAVSFIANRSRMEEVWLAYIQKWAEYDRHVIWQLGLRGKGDQAVWVADPNAPMTDEARGSLITDAIATQHRMIAQVLGREEFPSTATLWNEGSALYGGGFLRLPKGTIAIFADFGISQMFGDDFYTTPRLPDAQYGIYYHCAFWSLGPHLAEGCSPWKMAYSYRDAEKLNSLTYSILNVSNLRPVHYAAMVNAALLHGERDADAITIALDRQLFGNRAEQINLLRRRYYEAFADFGRDALKLAADQWQFYYRSHGDAPFTENAVTDGYLAFYGKCMLRGFPCAAEPDPVLARAELLRSEAAFQQLYADLCKLEPTPYLDQFLKYQTLHMLLLTRWMLCLMDTAAGNDRRDEGCTWLDGILHARKVLEQGNWRSWHRGDKKINILLLQEMTRQYGQA